MSVINHVTVFSMLVWSSLLFFLPNISKAADHIDWPEGINITFSEIDITDIFVWVPEKGKLAMVQNLHFSADETSEFSSEDVEYRFRIRPVTLKRTPGINVAVPQLIDEVPEVVVSCRVRNNAIAYCSTSGHRVSSRLGHVGRFRKNAPLQLFAGTIADPFFAHGDWLGQRISESFSTFDPYADPDYMGPVPMENPVNLTDGLGVLNITVVIDIADILGDSYKYYAVMADLLVNGSVFDRQGRPGINTLLIRVNELKDDYNASDAYALTAMEADLYGGLIRKGIAGWDKLDKKKDWDESHLDALVEAFLLDALIINLREKCDYRADPLFDIERAAGPLLKYADKCGGHTPLVDSMGSFVSFLVAGPHVLKDLYSDGLGFNPIQPTRGRWPFFRLFSDAYDD